jgi:hypothetical protein
VTHNRRSFNPAVGAFLMLVLAVASQPVAGQDPPSITGLAGLSSLNESQRRQAKQWATHWCAALESANADRSRDARRRLLEPLYAPGVRAGFRDEYGRQLVPELERLAEGRNELAAVNAVQIAAVLGTDQAVGFLRGRLDPEREQRMAVRLWAVNGVGLAARQGHATPRSVEGAMREVVRSAQRETEWIVLLRHFEAMAVGTAFARELQVELLRTVLDRIAEDDDGPSLLMQSVHHGLLALRHQFATGQMTEAERRQFGEALGPQIGRVLEFAVQHWESAKDADRSVSAAYAGAVADGETFLKLIDGQVRGNEPSPNSATGTWGNGNRAGFESVVRQWQTVLGRPPYAQTGR